MIKQKALEAQIGQLCLSAYLHRNLGQLVRMTAACSSDLIGVRDRALLLAAAGVGCADLVGLVEVAVPAAGSTDDRLRWAIHCGARLVICPVQALHESLEASGTRPNRSARYTIYDLRKDRALLVKR